MLICMAETSRLTLGDLPPISEGPWGQLPGKEESFSLLLKGPVVNALPGH